MTNQLRTFVFLFLFSSFAVTAQENDAVWSLGRCVQYAVEHNISIKQDSLTARQARYTLKQSELAQIPSTNVSSSYGRSFGRSINPTTNQFVEGGYNFLSASGSVSATVFSGFQVRNGIARNRYNLAASLADLEQLKDDVSLNVANGFLAALLAKEQITISMNQVALTSAQLDQTRAFADAGRLPELNVAQLESQLATDSANLINSVSSYNSALLDLKALLNLDFATPFAIQVPDVKAEDALMVNSLSPEEVFKQARTHFGNIKGSRLRVNAAEKGLAAAKGGLYPQLSIGYSVGTNFSSNAQTYTPGDIYYEKSGAYAVDPNTNNQLYVYSPNVTYKQTNTPFSSQFDNNLRHSISASLNIPIFNGWQTQLGIKQAQINLSTQELNQYNTELTLKQNVYKAHNNAVNSMQKYLAAKRAEQAAMRALEFAKKRYDLGLTTTVDLLVTQNSQYTAASNLVLAKYDLIFKFKVIDYYLGKELKL